MGLILSAALFKGEPVREFFEHLGRDGGHVTFVPVDGELDAEYTKRRGLDTRSFRYVADPEDNRRSHVEVDAIEISNERQVRAFIWLAEKIVKGWDGLRLDDGSELEFSPVNLKKLASIPVFIQPIIERAYALNAQRVEAEEKN